MGETWCSKNRYPDKISAEIMRSKMIHIGSRRNKYESRSYQCYGCKGWHLTSKPQYEWDGLKIG